MNFETRRAEKYRHLSSDKKVRTAKELLAKLQMLLHTVEKGGESAMFGQQNCQEDFLICLYKCLADLVAIICMEKTESAKNLSP